MTLNPLDAHASVMCCRDRARPWPPGKRLYLRVMLMLIAGGMNIVHHASNRLTETRGAREGEEGAMLRGAAVQKAISVKRFKTAR